MKTLTIKCPNCGAPYRIPTFDVSLKMYDLENPDFIGSDSDVEIKNFKEIMLDKFEKKETLYLLDTTHLPNIFIRVLVWNANYSNYEDVSVEKKERTTEDMLRRPSLFDKKFILDVIYDEKFNGKHISEIGLKFVLVVGD